MKQHRTSVLILAAFVVLGGLGSIGGADATNAAVDQRDNGPNRSRCSLMALKGTYAATLSGWASAGASRVPYSEVAYLKLDGKGGLTGTSRFSVRSKVRLST